jgi:WD40 repeat protein
LKRLDSATGTTINASAHAGGVLLMVRSPDGKWLATGGADGLVKLWHAQTGELADTFKKHGKAVTSLAFSPNSRTLASAAGESSIFFWDVLALRLGSSVSVSSPVRSLAFWPDHQSLVFGSDDNLLRGHHLTTGSQRTVLYSLGMVGSFQISSEGVLAFGCRNGATGYLRP